MIDRTSESILYPIVRPIIDLICKICGLPRFSNLQTRLDQQILKLEQIEKQQEALYRVISKIRASLDLETVFRTSTKETCKLLGVERVSVYRFNEDWGGEFVSDFEFAEPTWEDEEKLGKNTVWIDTYLQETQGGRYRENETLVVNDIYETGFSQCHLDLLIQFQIRAYATAPIFTGQKLWGVLAAYQHSKPYQWKNSEIRFLSQVATHLGFAVTQAQLLAQTEQKAHNLQELNEQQHVLFNVITEIRESLDLKTLFQTTTKEVRKVLQADRVGIFRFDPDTEYTYGEFVSESVLPIYDSVIKIKIHDHCFGEKYAPLYHQGRLQILSDIYESGLKDCHVATLKQFQVKAQIVVPLLQSKKLWGLLCIHQCSQPRQWQESEIQFIQQLAAHVNVALEQADLLTQSRQQAEQLIKVNTKLEELAKLDPLIPIPNRRYFDNVLDKEWQRLKRTGDYLSMILFDVDYFKLYNDKYGHPAGDECLIQVAQAAQDALKRPADLLARYGGEEFVIILPNTHPTGAIEVAKEIKDRITSLNIAHEAVPQGEPRVTVSLGVASQIPSVTRTSQQLIAKADQALYRAKEQGRDRWNYIDNG